MWVLFEVQCAATRCPRETLYIKALQAVTPRFYMDTRKQMHVFSALTTLHSRRSADSFRMHAPANPLLHPLLVFAAMPSLSRITPMATSGPPPVGFASVPMQAKVHASSASVSCFCVLTLANRNYVHAGRARTASFKLLPHPAFQDPLKVRQFR